jgi:ankyrin repeat protein
MDLLAEKEIIRTYLHERVDNADLSHLFIDNPEESFDIMNRNKIFGAPLFSPGVKNLSFLHKLVLKTAKYKELNNYLRDRSINWSSDIINQQCEFEWTPLHLACFNTNGFSTLETVEILLIAGADVNCEGRNKWTPLHVVINHCATISTIATLQLLIVNGANIDALTIYGTAPLHFAVAGGKNCDQACVKHLLEAGADYKLKPSSYTNILHLVFSSQVIKKIFPILNTLLSHMINKPVNERIDINEQDSLGNSLLHIAVNRLMNSYSIVSLFINYGINVNMRNLKGETALHILFQNYSDQSKKIIKLLLNNNADAFIMCNNVTVYSLFTNKLKEYYIYNYLEKHLDFSTCETCLTEDEIFCIDDDHMVGYCKVCIRKGKYVNQRIQAEQYRSPYQYVNKRRINVIEPQFSPKSGRSFQYGNDNDNNNNNNNNNDNNNSQSGIDFVIIDEVD